MTPTGQPLLYDPTTNEWHLGPAITAEKGIAPNRTPLCMLLENSILMYWRPTHSERRNVL